MNPEDPDYDPFPNKKFTFKELTQDALEQLALRKNFDKLYKLADKAPEKCMPEFKQLKFNDELYSVGDSLLIQVRQTDFLARIKRIVSIKSFKDDCELPLVIINLYCNKDQIALQYADFYPCFSLSELFLTQDEHAILVDAIKHKVSVLSFEEYDQLDEKSSHYFMRAAYNTLQESFLPETKLWPVSCFCRMPTNPDLDYILCEICQKWIHQTCAKVSKEQAEQTQNFICRICQGI